MLHAEYGIVVYPSALTEEIDAEGLGVDVTFTDAYTGHIGKCACPLPKIKRLAANIFFAQSCSVDVPIRVTRRHVPSNTFRNHRPCTRNKR